MTPTCERLQPIGVHPTTHIDMVIESLAALNAYGNVFIRLMWSPVGMIN